MPQNITSELIAAITAAVNSPFMLLLPGLSIHCCGTRNYNFRQRMGWEDAAGEYVKELPNRKCFCDGKDCISTYIS